MPDTYIKSHKLRMFCDTHDILTRVLLRACQDTHVAVQHWTNLQSQQVFTPQGNLFRHQYINSDRRHHARIVCSHVKYCGIVHPYVLLTWITFFENFRAD